MQANDVGFFFFLSVVSDAKMLPQRERNTVLQSTNYFRCQPLAVNQVLFWITFRGLHKKLETLLNKNSAPQTQIKSWNNFKMKSGDFSIIKPFFFSNMLMNNELKPFLQSLSVGAFA